MHYTAEIAAREHPDHLRVFIGPCLAKRKEGLDDPLVDYVLTAEEIGALFLALGIDVAGSEEVPVSRPAKAGGRGFPLSGGVAEAVRRNLPGGDANFHPECVNGLDKEGIATMKAWSEGRNTGNILEVMACPGGCVAGPMVYANPKTATSQLKKIIEESGG
jgi:iron only hydrogenase large subunit-like protein